MHVFNVTVCLDDPRQGWDYIIWKQQSYPEIKIIEYLVYPERRQHCLLLSSMLYADV